MEAKARVAVVTGGGRGIGRAICMVLADRGTKVVVADIDFDGAKATAAMVEAQGRHGFPLQVDVSSRPSVKGMVEDTVEHFGRLDILVNNAGICPPTPFEQTTDEEWARVLAVNLTGPFLCTQEAVKVMTKQRWGRVITISSVAGKMGSLRAGAHYAAAKGGLIPLMFCVARQYANLGITANVVAPGQTETDMILGWPEEALRQFADSIPVGRLGRPEEIAAAVAFLASDEASFINGEVLDVNGGFLMD
jgi:3-oxoacyl-[acyl-carrier protein] reductase